jgi:hypothetical protein
VTISFKHARQQLEDFTLATLNGLIERDEQRYARQSDLASSNIYPFIALYRNFIYVYVADISLFWMPLSLANATCHDHCLTRRLRGDFLGLLIVFLGTETSRLFSTIIGTTSEIF